MIRAMPRLGSIFSVTPFAFGLLLLLAFGVVACEGKLDKRRFRRKAEKAFIEVHPGWTIMKRDKDETLFVRGDQVDSLAVSTLFDQYTAGKQSSSDFFDAWIEVQEKVAAARRRTLEQAKTEVIPIIKSGTWISIQDLGAIGPERIRDRIRPWRKKLAEDVYVVLGVPEEKLGYRIASIDEVGPAEKQKEWVDIAVTNVVKMVGTSSSAVPMTGNDGRLLALDFQNIDGVSALILDERFRRSLLTKFRTDELGAAVPIRNVLVIFDTSSFVTVKPIRARTHKLYDTQNHPGFRGLLRFDREGLTVLEPARPKKKKRKK